MTMSADDFAPMHFSTADLSPREKVQVWRETFSRAALKLDVTPADDAAFHAELAMLMLPGLGVSWGRNSGQRLERTRELIACGDDDLCLIIGENGHAALQQMGRETLLSPGGAVMVSGAEVGISDCSDGFAHFTLKLPRRLLASKVADIDGAVMQRLDTDPGALHLLRLYLGAIREDLSSLTPELRELAAIHIADLVALAIGATRDASELAQMRGIRAARVREIIEQIKAGFSDPSFSPGMVAARLRLSPRYVQDLLQDTGESFTERVLEKRLQKARRMLMSRTNDRLTIGEIAYSSGFNEVSYFNRCFRRRFGARPTDVRTGGQAAGTRDRPEN